MLGLDPPVVRVLPHMPQTIVQQAPVEPEPEVRELDPVPQIEQRERMLQSFAAVDSPRSITEAQSWQRPLTDDPPVVTPAAPAAYAAPEPEPRGAEFPRASAQPSSSPLEPLDRSDFGSNLVSEAKQQLSALLPDTSFAPAPPAHANPAEAATIYAAAPVPALVQSVPAAETSFPRARAEWEQEPFRGLWRRGFEVAVIAFAGWFTAVLILIVAYRFINPPVSTLMVLRWLSGTSISQEWVPIERISPNLVRAVIVSEDGRFCTHWGIDFLEIAAAIKRSPNGTPRGASTITMQVAKNLFLLPVKSYLRKIVEVPLTYAIELFWPKWRILEVYLNVAEWGPGIFGAERAARAHFGRSAMGLSARQAAQLAVALPNPVSRHPGSAGAWSSRRASVIQNRAARTPEASSCIED